VVLVDNILLLVVYKMADDDSINEYYNQDIPQHTTHLLDEEVLGQIKLNDPAITSLAELV